MNELATRYNQMVVRRPNLFLGMIGFITVIFGLFLLTLKINASPYVLERQHSSRVNEPVVNRTFTNTGEQALVSVVSNTGNIFNLETLSLIEILSDRFNAMSITDDADIDWLKGLSTTSTQDKINAITEGGITKRDLDNLSTVKALLLDSGDLSVSEAMKFENLIDRAAPITKIRSISRNIENITAINDDLDIHPLMEQLPTIDGLKNLEHEARSNEMYNGMLLSDDGTSTTIQIEFSLSEADSPSMLRAYQKILEITKSIDSKDKIYISGPPVISAQIADTIKTDNDTFFPVVVLVISLVLYISFRRKQGVIIPLMIAILTTVWTLGLMAAFGIEQNIITTVLPVFLITIGVADAIHFITAFYDRNQNSTNQEAATSTFDHLFTPLLLTSITTICGFIALSFTELTFLREFGLFIAAGVFFAFIITMTLLPALLPKLKGIETIKNHESKKTIEDMSISISSKLISHSKVSILIILSLGALALFIGKDVPIDNENIALFSDNARLKIDTNEINDRFGGTIPVNLWFKSEKPNEFSTPEAVIALNKITEYLKSRTDIGYTISAADFVKRMHQVLNNTEYQLPEKMSQAEIAQYYFLYENSNAQQLRDVLGPNYKNARIIAFANTDKATTWQNIIKDTRQYATSVLPDGVTLEFTGFGYLMAENLTEIIHGQVKSLLIATALITSIMILLFRSISIGLIAITPLILTLLINFALMTIFGINLDIGTSMIAGIVFGIGVDYPIHFMAILKRRCEEYNEALTTAINHTLRAVAKPITINSLSLALGFSVLSLSSHGTLVNLGLLISGTMLTCGILSIALLPLLTYVIRPKALAYKNDHDVDPTNAAETAL